MNWNPIPCIPPKAWTSPPLFVGTWEEVTAYLKTQLDLQPMKRTPPPPTQQEGEPYD